MMNNTLKVQSILPCTFSVSVTDPILSHCPEHGTSRSLATGYY